MKEKLMVIKLSEKARVTHKLVYNRLRNRHVRYKHNLQYCKTFYEHVHIYNLLSTLLFCEVDTLEQWLTDIELATRSNGILNISAISSDIYNKIYTKDLRGAIDYEIVS